MRQQPLQPLQQQQLMRWPEQLTKLQRFLVVHMGLDGTLRVSCPVKAIPFVQEWLKTIIEDYNSFVDGDASILM